MADPAAFAVALQPARTESGADESWEDKAEKEDVPAAAGAGDDAAAEAAAAAAAGPSPFASGSSEDDGRKRYTLDFLKKHREQHKARPPELQDGEWIGNPAEALSAYGPGGFDNRLGGRRGSRGSGIDRWGLRSRFGLLRFMLRFFSARQWRCGSWGSGVEDCYFTRQWGGVC